MSLLIRELHIIGGLSIKKIIMKVTKTILHSMGYRKYADNYYFKRRMVVRPGLGKYPCVIRLHYIHPTIVEATATEYGDVGMGLPESSRLSSVEDIKGWESFAFLKD